MFIVKKFVTIDLNDNKRKKGMIYIMKNKICSIDETKVCDDCGECTKCLMDATKECDNCGDCIKPEYLGARKISISNIENAFVEEVGINEMKKGILKKKNLLLKKFILHDVCDLRPDYIITQTKDQKDQEENADEITKEEKEKYDKAIEDFRNDVELDENGLDIQYIEDIDGLSELISDENSTDKGIVEEFPGLLKFDKDYRSKKNEKKEKNEKNEKNE